MTLFKKLTAAEVCFLIDKNNNLKGLLKITFIDLILKKVLKFIEIEKPAHNNNTIWVYKYVTIGENFNKHKVLSYETFFLDAFKTDQSLQILFSNFVKMGYQNASSLKHFKQKLISTKVLKDYFSQNFIYDAVGYFNLNTAGGVVKRQLQIELKSLNNRFATSYKNYPSKCAELIQKIGTNVLLIDGFDYEFLSEIYKDIHKELNRKEHNEPDISSGCFGCGGTWDVGDFSHSFDSSHSGDSGCSGGGDSGCGSGCSGCGGCGGCGS